MAVEPTMIYQIAGIGIVIAILNIFLAQAGRHTGDHAVAAAADQALALHIITSFLRLGRSAGPACYAIVWRYDVPPRQNVARHGFRTDYTDSTEPIRVIRAESVSCYF